MRQENAMEGLRLYQDQTKFHKEIGFMLNPDVATLTDAHEMVKRIYEQTGLYTDPYVSGGTFRFVVLRAEVAE